MKLNENPEDARLTSGKNISYWTDSMHPEGQHPLQENLVTEVVIVGGGIAGLSIAYCLTEAGKRVVLVEDGSIGSGETGRTTAHLVTALDDRYYHLEKVFGEEKTKLIAECHQGAIDFVEQTIQKENINCGFERVDGYLFLHPSDEHPSLAKEYEAALKAGVQIESLHETPGMFPDQPSLRFKNQAQFHPLLYIQGLRKAIERKGGKIYTSTHAEEMDHEGITTTDGYTVKAEHVVIATNSPVNNLFTMFEKQYAYRTYVIGALVKKDSLPKALWWDTGDFSVDPKVPPYHYVRVHPYNDQHDLLISGGEDHPTGNTSKTDVPETGRYALLEAWTRNHFPIEEIIYRWSGQVLEPMDCVAFIGRNPFDKDNVYIVTGDSGNGMTHCSFAGLLITDLILGKENKWADLYSPTRFTLSESTPILKQMMTETLSYLKQMPNFNNADELDDIQPGEGRIVKMLEEEFGVYRDKTDRLHIVSSKCTHLKCSLAWNADELSWDCPCHGSRFTYEGKVIQGPANFDLPVYQFNEQEKELIKQ
jgi:glycine/D-amino acid oxidase-like deaminating enzyme/nitrite reductase/ring-hydroxylating ferredoxin subunit